jgi:NTP pyrophosphatase (non-canonical NTP hydrolase)
MEFQKLVHRAMALRKQYEDKEKELYGSPSSEEHIAEGFAGDVNNLIKFMQAEQGKRDIAYSTDKIESQLAHCLWSVITVSQMRGINLERAFMEAMDRLEAHMMEADE